LLTFLAHSAIGAEFIVSGKTYKARATREVVLCAGVVQTPQVLELSGIGNREVLSAAGINTIVESPSVGANFQDHVLGGMVFECAPDVLSLDALHGDEYGQKQQMIYEKEHTGPFGSPGMLMGFVSYASLVSEQELQATIAEIKKNSLAKTAFEKKQEQLIIDQLSDPTFANLQTFLIPANMDLTACGDQLNTSVLLRQGRTVWHHLYVSSTRSVEAQYTSRPQTPRNPHELTQAISATKQTPRS
jgi:choline dehydrogenase-like flavoprotein